MDLERVVQAHIARVAITPSAARGQGASGVVHAARVHLAQLDLSRFCRGGEFPQLLDEETEALISVLPRAAQSWGLARKLVNIFLRDASYTVHLREPYRLSTVEALLEVPLDSITATELKRTQPPGALPAWVSVKGLSPEASDRFQAAAQSVARSEGIARVHLDALWWARATELNPELT